MKRIFILTVFIFALATAKAQPYVSNGGSFFVDQKEFCTGYTITIFPTLGRCTNAPGNNCIMDYENGKACPVTPNCQNVLTYTYNTAGKYRLFISYQSAPQDFIDITVNPSIQPAFEIYSCSSSQVSIKVTDKNYDQYSIDFGDGSALVQIPFSNNQVAQHAYAVNGNYSISVRGKKLNAADNCNAMTKPFQAITTLPIPQITSLTALDASTLKLDFVPANNIQYKLEIAINSINFQQFQTLFGVSTVTIPNLRLDDNYYCFRLSSFDPCTGLNNYSQQLCSHNFDLTVASDVNKLSWQTSNAGITRVEVLRDKGLYTSIPGAPLAYSDIDIKCNVTYCYQIRSISSTGAVSTSLEKCGKSFTTVKPATILNSSSVFSAVGVDLSWVQNPAYKASTYSILRSQKNGVYNLLNNSKVTGYVDTSYSTEAEFCYKVNYIDECLNKSADSKPICPIRLQGFLNDRNEITLNWSAYSGWNLGVKNYVLEKFDRTGSLLKSTDVGTSLTFFDDQQDLKNQVVSYKITAKSVELGLANSTSNPITFTKAINLFYPTAFTPDSQGPVENESFGVGGQYISKLELSIFDRWGSQVFYTNKNETWDGTLNGQRLPITSYVWTANITDLIGRQYKRSGTVVLMRK